LDGQTNRQQNQPHKDISVNMHSMIYGV